MYIYIYIIITVIITIIITNDNNINNDNNNNNKLFIIIISSIIIIMMMIIIIIIVYAFEYRSGPIVSGSRISFHYNPGAGWTVRRSRESCPRPPKKKARGRIGQRVNPPHPGLDCLGGWDLPPTL